MKHPFKIGRVHRNRLGSYEIVHLDESRNEMVIRYLESGVEVDISISRQARIWRNMSWEDQDEVQRKGAEEERFQQGYGDDFAGLEASDFKTSTEGTRWRSRRGLAGHVALLLTPNTPYTFVSWAIYRRPVAFLTRREDYRMAAFDMGTRKARYTIELDERNVYYGFLIEGQGGNMDQSWDWLRFLPAVRDNTDLQTTITDVETNHGARFLARVSNGQGTFHFADGLEKGAVPLWDEQNPAGYSLVDRLSRLEAIPDGQWVEVYLMATTTREAALRAGMQISHNMATVLRAMLPVYTTAAVRDEVP